MHEARFTPEDLDSGGTSLGTVRLDGDNPATLQFRSELKIERDSSLCGLAGWFECELAEGVWMTNSPLADSDTAGAIARSQVFLPLERPVEVLAGMKVTVTLRARHDANIFTWTVTPEGGEAQAMNSWRSRILTTNDLKNPMDVPIRLNRRGEARKTVLALVDGQRTAREIEALICDRFPDLLPTPEATSRFVRNVLGRDTAT